jgi:serine/threonine protein kinase
MWFDWLAFVEMKLSPFCQVEVCVMLLNVCTLMTHILSFEIELIDGGCLADLLRDVKVHLSLSQQLLFMVEISSGMAHLHQHNIVHR